MKPCVLDAGVVAAALFQDDGADAARSLLVSGRSLHAPDLVHAEIANVIHYATANLSARKMVLPEDLTNPAIYPPSEVIANCESLVDVGDATRLYDEAWTAIQAA